MKLGRWSVIVPILLKSHQGADSCIQSFFKNVCDRRNSQSKTAPTQLTGTGIGGKIIPACSRRSGLGTSCPPTVCVPLRMRFRLDSMLFMYYRTDKTHFLQRNLLVIRTTLRHKPRSMAPPEPYRRLWAVYRAAIRAAPEQRLSKHLSPVLSSPYPTRFRQNIKTKPIVTISSENLWIISVWFWKVRDISDGGSWKSNI